MAPADPGPAARPGPAADDRQCALRQLKLRALVREHWGPESVFADGADSPPLATAIPGGAALAAPEVGVGWVLIDDPDVGSLGGALAWAYRHSVVRLHVLVEDDSRSGYSTGALASGVVRRRAGWFADPATVWAVDGRRVRLAEPEGPPRVAASLDELDPRCGALADLLVAHGADPVVEHGVLRGEVLGLEVARAVAAGGGWELVVGVGEHDRQARAEMSPNLDVATSLDEVVRVVRNRRVATAGRHPANLLARERWLRALVMAQPELVGARQLTPLAAPSPRRDLRVPSPAPAGGPADDGGSVVAVCSTGIDVDLVPAAADVRAGWDPCARLVLVLPVGDDYPVTRALASALAEPARIVTVGRDWPAQLTPSARLSGST